MFKIHQDLNTSSHLNVTICLLFKNKYFPNLEVQTLKSRTYPAEFPIL